MSVLTIAAIGVGLVLLSILGLRLHPLLGLLIGSLFIFAATPRELSLTKELSSQTLEIVGLASGGMLATSTAGDAGEYQLWSSEATGDLPVYNASIVLNHASSQMLMAAEQRGELSPVNAIWYSVSEPSPPIVRGDRLIAVGAVEAFDQTRWSNLGKKLASGFADTFRKLGIPVTMAAIVGVCLLDSGAAARLVMAIVRLFGSRGTAPALTCSGFILGVPVFFDNVFYLLLPLAKAVGRLHPDRYLMSVMAIIVGATMAHSLVPPTPGPLLVAAAVGVSVGTMMIAGFIVGSIAACFGFAYGAMCSRWITLLPPDDGAGTPSKVDVGQSGSPLESGAESRPIPLWLAALPIALPIAILGGSEVVDFMASVRGPSSRFALLSSWFSVINDPGLIFIATALLSIGLLRYFTNQQTVGRSVARGVSDAGTIVLLTCAGGAFGASLQQLDLGSVISRGLSGPGTSADTVMSPWGMLVMAFALTAVIRVAQGSATVAMITSAAIVAPVMQSVALPFHPIYVALAIGCGSKPLPWMNDSGFWQVATMTGMTTGQTLRSFSVALTIMGVVGFAVTLLGAWVLPLV